MEEAAACGVSPHWLLAEAEEVVRMVEDLRQQQRPGRDEVGVEVISRATTRQRKCASFSFAPRARHPPRVGVWACPLARARVRLRFSSRMRTARVRLSVGAHPPCARSSGGVL